MSEENIIFETDSHYVYKVKHGCYEIREHNGTYSLVVGKFDLPDEDSDAKERAIEFCKLGKINIDELYHKFKKYE